MQIDIHTHVAPIGMEVKYLLQSTRYVSKRYSNMSDHDKRSQNA